MNKTIETVIENLTAVYVATEEALGTWTSEESLKFPTLMGMLAVKLNWDEKQVRENDPLVRHYVRHNSEWTVDRGAKGGLQRVAVKNAKEEAQKATKAAAKKAVRDAVEAKVAENTTTTNNE